jgi:hypothetical protein
VDRCCGHTCLGPLLSQYVPRSSPITPTCPCQYVTMSLWNTIEEACWERKRLARPCLSLSRSTLSLRAAGVGMLLAARRRAGWLGCVAGSGSLSSVLLVVNARASLVLAENARTNTRSSLPALIISASYASCIPKCVSLMYHKVCEWVGGWVCVCKHTEIVTNGVRNTHTHTRTHTNTQTLSLTHTHRMRRQRRCYETRKQVHQHTIHQTTHKKPYTNPPLSTCQCVCAC